MTGINWWRHYDKDGTSIYTTTVRHAGGRRLDVTRATGAKAFTLQVDGNTVRTFPTLRDAKQHGEKLAQRMIEQYEAQQIARGLHPAPMFDLRSMS